MESSGKTCLRAASIRIPSTSLAFIHIGVVGWVTVEEPIGDDHVHDIILSNQHAPLISTAVRVIASAAKQDIGFYSLPTALCRRATAREMVVEGLGEGCAGTEGYRPGWEDATKVRLRDTQTAEERILEGMDAVVGMIG